MTNGNPGTLGAFIIAEIICCGGLILLASGVTLGAVGVWLTDHVSILLGAAGVLLLAGLYLRRRSGNRTAGIARTCRGRPGGFGLKSPNGRAARRIRWDALLHAKQSRRDRHATIDGVMYGPDCARR